MEKNIILYGVLALVIFFLFSIFKKKKEFKEADTTKIPETNNVSKMVTNKKSANNVKKGSIFDQVPNPLIKEKPQAKKWTESSSYENDINNITKASVETNAVIDEEINSYKTKILLVDDSLTVRKYVQTLLADHDYELILKSDGLEAIEYLNTTKYKPELIISDIEMPNMDGFELIERVRKDIRFNNIAILVISSHAENHLALMESQNIEGFIKKPFEDYELINQVEYLLD